MFSAAPLGRGHAFSPGRMTPVPPGGRWEASVSFRLGPLLVCLRSLEQKSEGYVSTQVKLSFPWFSEPECGCKHEHTPRSDLQRALGAGSLRCVCSLWALPLPRLSAGVSTAFCRASHVLRLPLPVASGRCKPWVAFFTGIPRWWRSREKP